MKRRTSPFLMAAIFAAMMLLFAACGDDDDAIGDDSSPPSDGEGDDPADDGAELSGDPVKLMVIAAKDSAGAGQNFPDYEASATAAGMAVNANGGIGGHPVEIIFCNEKNDPNEAANCAREAVSEGVTSVISAFTRHGASYLPILEEAGIPSLGNDLLSPDDFANPMSFPFSGGQLSSLGATPFALEMEGATSVVIVRTDVDAAATASGFVKMGIEAAGLEFVNEIAVPSDATDYAPFAAAIESSGADSVVLVQAELPSSLTLQAMAQAGIRGDFIVGLPVDVFTDDTVQALGADIVDGLVATGATPSVTATDEFPVLVDYSEQMDAAEEAGVAGADIRRPANLRAWAAVHIIDQLLEDADAVDAAALLDALNAAEDIEVPFIPSWTPSMTVSDSFPRVSNPAIYFQKWEGTDLTLVDPERFNVFEALGLAAAS